MNDFPRLVDGAGNDPATMLLRSARADKAEQGSKERMRAMLGLVDPVEERIPALPKRLSDERVKRSRKIARFIPFQHLVSPEKPAATRKLGPVVVAFVQVAAMVAALFVRPVPRIDPVTPEAPSRRDEPELLFFVPKKAPRDSVPAQASLSDNAGKPASARKETFGAATQSRSVRNREPAPLQESIVGDEHAGVLTENDQRSAMPMASAPESLETSAGSSNAPMVFQAGMTQPVRIAGTDPSYPQIARARGVTGTVIMRCLVTEKGIPENCTVLKSPAYLDEAVLSAARGWRFTPVTFEGRAVPVNYVFRYNFKLG